MPGTVKSPFHVSMHLISAQSKETGVSISHLSVRFIKVKWLLQSHTGESESRQPQSRLNKVLGSFGR